MSNGLIAAIAALSALAAFVFGFMGSVIAMRSMFVSKDSCDVRKENCEAIRGTNRETLHEQLVANRAAVARIEPQIVELRIMLVALCLKMQVNLSDLSNGCKE